MAYHLSPLLLGAGAHVAVGHFAGLLAAELYCRSVGVASERFVEYFAMLPFKRCVKNSTVQSSLKKSSKEQRRLEVNFFTSKFLE
jgi:hypothetical protein